MNDWNMHEDDPREEDLEAECYANLEAEALLARHDAALAETARTLGCWWFVTPSGTHNAREALARWEQVPDATILTNDAGEYGVLREVFEMPKGWSITSPEEIERSLGDA